MAGEIGKFSALLTADASGFTAGMNQAQRSAAGLQQSASKSFAGIGSAVTSMAAVAATAFAAVGVVSFAKNMVMAASDTSESLNKVSVVFGASAKSIEDFAATSAKSLGLSRLEALNAAGTFGNLFVAMKIGQPQAADMSKGILKLAADLGSFNNIPVDVALEKLRAGLVGETEPLRALGVNLSAAQVKVKAFAMGFKEVDGELSAAAKAQASYALIMEQTTTAQGDFANTSTGMANSMKIIGATWDDMVAQVGNKVLPILAPLISKFALALPAALETAGKGIETVTGIVTALATGRGFDMLYDGFNNAFGPRIASILAAFIDPIARIRVAVGEMVDSVLNSTSDAGPEIVARLTAWVDAFLAWVPDAVRELLPLLSGLLDKVLAWVKTNAGPLSEKLFAEWIPAFISWVVPAAYKLVTETLPQLIKDIGVWIVTDGGPKLVELAWELGKAIINGIVNGIKNLGGQIGDALWGQLPDWAQRLISGVPLAVSAAAGAVASAYGPPAGYVEPDLLPVPNRFMATQSTDALARRENAAADRERAKRDRLRERDRATAQARALIRSLGLQDIHTGEWDNAGNDEDGNGSGREERIISAMEQARRIQRGGNGGGSGDLVINMDGQQLTRIVGFRSLSQSQLLARVGAG